MDNVVELRKGYVVADDIEDFINGLETENTKKRYLDSINKFIKWKWDIPMEFLSIKQINSLTYTDFKKFRDAKRKKYSAGTVNNFMTALYSLLKELKRVQDEGTGQYIYEIDDIEKLRVKRLRNNNVNSAGYLEWDEVTDWIMFLEESDESNKDRKIAFLKLARLTGLRKQSIIDLKFSDIRKENQTYVLHSYLKGKKHKVAIPDNIAEMLFSLKRVGETKDSKVLGLSGKTLERTFAMLLKEFEVDEQRNLTIHSLRNLSAWEIYLSTGKNIIAVQQHLGHSDIQVTYSYLKERESFSMQPTLYVKEDLNCDELGELDKDQLLEVLNELSRSSKYEIINKAKEMKLLTS